LKRRTPNAELRRRKLFNTRRFFSPSLDGGLELLELSKSSRSVISSARKQGFNISKALALAPEQLAAHLQS
jgi:hypothetical protein